MLEMDGLETFQGLQAHHTGLAFVILTTYNEDELMVRGLRADAHVYLLKDMERRTLIAAIEAAARDDMLLCPQILQRGFGAPVARRGSSTAASKRHGRPDGTRAEVLRAAASGAPSKKIARRLAI